MSIKRLYNDCETTGTDPLRHGIIQWTSIVRIDGVEVDRINLKIQPFLSDAIEEEALKSNGITREELFTADRLTPDKAYWAIQKFLAKHVEKFDKKDKFFWVGYKASFDADFTREFFKKNKDNYFGSYFWTPVLDVMILAGYLLMPARHLLKDFKLKTVFEYLFPDEAMAHELASMEGEDPWHDALFDVERTIDVETILREQAGALGAV